MDIIAFYLPQFYSFPENDKWWGKGFTEWTNVKKSKPLYKGHYQPTVPLNNNYYTLEDINVMKWQTDLAKRYGVSGFCFYHYWFGEGRQLMEKPVDNYLRHTEIDFPFCLCWANHNWSRTWVGGDQDILMDVRYGGEEEWEKHFAYMLPFFEDKRYIHIDGKPVLVIYHPQLIPCYGEMIPYLQRRAKEEGLEGLTIVSQYMFEEVDDSIEKLVDYKIQYEPSCSLTVVRDNKKAASKISPRFVRDMVKYTFKGKIKRLSKGKICKCITYNYDYIWEYILNRPVKDDKLIAGTFAKCDVSPRRQDRALIFRGATPQKFEKYMTKLVDKVQKEYKQKIIFVSAWNEWGEGMYLEPDEKDKYGYLEGIRNSLSNIPDSVEKER